MSLFGTSWDDPKTAAIMGLAGGLLQGNAGAGLQQGLLGAQRQSQLNAQSQRMMAQDAMEAEKFGFQKKQWQSDLDAKQRASFDAERVRDILGKVVTGEVDAPTAIAAGVPADLIKAVKESKDYGRPKGTRQIEVDDGKGGKRIALVDDYGQEVAGYAGYVPPQLVNLGDRQVFTTPTAGAAFKVGMSPSERDASARGWASNRLAQDRFAFDRAGGIDGVGGQKAPAGYRWNADRTALEPIPGGPAMKADNVTEGERKAATLLARMEGSLSQLDAALKESPGAAKPEILPRMIAAMPGPSEAAANMATSPARQRVEAAQLDALDAALTLGTGAAYTREQLEGYRKSFFPQIGDSEATVRDKTARRAALVESARIAAGRAAPATKPKPTMAGQDILNAADAILGVR